MGLKIYVGCLPGDATEAKVKEVFSQFGEVASVELVKKKSNKCVGSGYVTCADQVSFDKIIKSEVYYESRKLETSKYLEKHELQALHEDINLRKLLVKNIPADLTNEEMEQKFSIFGEVINAFISTDKRPDGKTTSNYGIVIFKERLGAYKALNGKFLLKGQPLIIRLHRFKNVGEAVYTVRG
jgi:RNA recognition motif-containing protein